VWLRTKRIEDEHGFPAEEKELNNRKRREEIWTIATVTGARSRKE